MLSSSRGKKYLGLLLGLFNKAGALLNNLQNSVD